MFGNKWKRAAAAVAAAVVLTGSLAGNAQVQAAAAVQEPEFTDEERQFIESCGSWKVGYVTDRVPISFQEETTGELCGVSRQIFDRIEELSGLDFEYAPLPGGSVTYDLLREGGFDLVTNVEYNEENKNARGILISQPYLNTRKVIVGRSDVVFDQSQKLQIAVAMGSQTLKKVIAEQFPNFEIVDYNTIGDCFEAVFDGDVDVLMQNQFVAEYWMSRAKYEKLKVIPVVGLADQLCFSAVTPIGEPDSQETQQKETLISIIDKTIACISEEEVNTYLIESTMSHQYTYKLDDILYRYRYAVRISVFALVVLSVLVVLILRYRLKTLAARAEAEAKGRFLSAMSHELKTPINGMAGLNQLMAQNLDDGERMRDYLEQSALTTRYLLSLVNDILDMSQLQDNETVIEKKSFLLPLVLATAESIERIRIERKQMTFTVEADVPCPRLLGDELRVQQVLLNLLDNAHKFTPEGGSITLRVSQKKNADAVLTQIEVADTGCGMSEEFQKKIFDSFTQELESVSKGNQGTGLGMAISWRLAKLMGGDLTVQSAVGKGSCFTFTFLAREDRQGAESPAKEADKKPKDQVHILVAEDNELNAEIMLELLHEAGYSASLAGNGQKAVELFAASEPGWFSYILMDLLMPVKDGFEAAEEIRRLHRPDAKTVKIYACTANDMQGERERAVESGMDGFLAKPVDLKDLLALLS